MGANEKPAATFHGIGEEHECWSCGEVYLSPRAAMLCEERDLAEERDARRPPRHRDTNIIRAYD